MKVTEALREAWRDLASGAAAAGALALVFGIVLGGLVGLHTSELVHNVRSAQRWVAAGAATLVVSAEARVDGRACDALAAMRTVIAAGALRAHADGTTPLVLPRTSIPTFDVSSGFADGLSRDAADGVGVMVSRDVGRELGLSAGSLLPTVAGSTPILSVYDHPDDGRDPELAYAILAPALDDGRPYDACWVTIWPQEDTAAAAARRVVLPASDPDRADRVATSQLNSRLGRTFAPASTDGAVGAAALCGSVGVVLGIAAVMRRRLSIASDRHAGVPVLAQVLGTSIQHLVWALVGAAGGASAGCAMLRGLDTGDAAAIALEGAMTAAVGVGGAVLGGVLGHMVVRERALHRYFRTRR